MEYGAATSRSNSSYDLAHRDDRATQERLDALLRLNSEKAIENVLYRTDRERIQAGLMSHPIPSQNVFAYFGLMIGSLPLFTVVAKLMSESIYVAPGEGLVLVLLVVAGITSGVVGYASGRVLPSLLRRIPRLRAPNNMIIMALIGFAWGAVSGGVGGVFLFLIGSIFGAIFGGIIGAIALPIFAAFHSALRSGDVMERKHFLPVAFGMTLTFCAFIAGL